jgi:hypothetical protein
MRVMKFHSPVSVRLRHLSQVARAASPDAIRLPRLAWFNVKRALRMPTSSDRKFLLREFGRKLEDGVIGPGCHVTVAGRNDGMGSQALARMSAICLAKRYGLTYVHTPFLAMQHAEGLQTTSPYEASEEWAATWERILNLGHNEVNAAECELPRVEIEDFIADQKWRSSPCLLSAGYFSMIIDGMPDAYHAVTESLRAKYFTGIAQKRQSTAIEVCAHLRRGVDVRPDNPDTAYRYVANDAMAKSILMTQSILKDLGLTSRARLFSQGDERDFDSFQELGFELHLNTPAISTFREFVEADVLIMTKSSFSYVAALLSDGVKLYDRFARSPLSDWIVRENDGSFDQAKLRAHCASVFAARRGRPGDG